MTVANDWDIDYVGKEIRHIDGVLSYDANAGTSPAAGDFVIGGTSGAVARVIAGSDLSGTNATGTLTLTDTVGLFADNETLRVLSKVPFDTVANGGFKVGDTITGPTTESIDVQAISYNRDGLGTGTIFGDNLTSGFADNEQLDVSGGSTAVADVNGSETDNSGLFTSCLVNGTLAVPGTANTNNSVIVHYDAGTIAIPEDAEIADATTGAIGNAQQVLGSTTTGSVRLVNSDTTGGAWTDNNNLELRNVVHYDNQVSGQVFSIGDVVVGDTSGATGRVLAVIDDGDSTGKLILANGSGTWDHTTPDDIEVDSTKIAEVENNTFVLNAAVLNLPNGVRTEQRTTQGGIYASTDSINIVRSANAVYTYIQDTFDELAQLDDLPPLQGNVKDQLYTIINSWTMPDLSMRFIEKGSFVDSGSNNVFVNYSSILSGADVTDNGFLYTSTNPTPMPDLYVEQNGTVLSQYWLEGPINVLIKVKTRTDPRHINSTVPSIGQLINSGTVTWFSRPYLRQYDHFESTTTVGGVVVVPLNSPDDLNNTTGTHSFSYDGGSAATLTVGEEFTTTTGGTLKVGIVTAQAGDAGATGTVTYALKSGTQFADNDACTGGVSGKTLNVNGSITSVVAGYNADIKEMTVDRRFTGGTTTGTFVIGETVTQTGTGATGYVLEDDSGTIYVMDASGTFNGTGQLTGGVSSATSTPTATAAFTTVPKDIGDGTGDTNFTGVISANITNGSPQGVLKVYEWSKYITRKESSSNIGGPGSAAATNGNIFRRLDGTYAEVKTAPLGSFAGGKMFGAQGWFIDKDTLASADLQNIQLINNAGATLNPPNLQTLEVTNLVSGNRVAVYRATGAGLSTILRNEFTVGTVGGGNNQSGDSTILLAAGTRSVSPLPNDVPDSGILRIEDPNEAGVYLSFAYNAVNRTTNVFTLASGTIGTITSSADLNATDNAHVAFIEEQSAGTQLSNTLQYVANIPLTGVNRQKGILPETLLGTFTATGASLGARRDTDSIVDLP